MNVDIHSYSSFHPSEGNFRKGPVKQGPAVPHGPAGTKGRYYSGTTEGGGGGGRRRAIEMKKLIVDNAILSPAGAGSLKIATQSQFLQCCHRSSHMCPSPERFHIFAYATHECMNATQHGQCSAVSPAAPPPPSPLFLFIVLGPQFISVHKQLKGGRTLPPRHAVCHRVHRVFMPLTPYRVASHFIPVVHVVHNQLTGGRCQKPGGGGGAVGTTRAAAT